MCALMGLEIYFSNSGVEVLLLLHVDAEALLPVIISAIRAGHQDQGGIEDAEVGVSLLLRLSRLPQAMSASELPMKS